MVLCIFKKCHNVNIHLTNAICFVIFFVQLIPNSVQKRAFPDLPTEVMVILPDDTVTEWSISWYSKDEASTSTSTEPEMIGELGAGWCDYFRDKYKRDGNRSRVFEMLLFEIPQGDVYLLFVDPV